jgi:hypothetical protein
MAEFWRALKTLKALQAEQTLETGPALPAHPLRPAARPPLAERARPNEPERHSVSTPEPRLEYVLPDRPAPTPGALHEPAAPGGRTNPRAAPAGAMLT